MSVREVLGKVTVSIFCCLSLIQELGMYSAVSELILDLVNLYLKLSPFSVIKAEESAFLVFLRDSNKSGTVCMLPSLKIAEIAFRQKLSVPVCLALKLFLGKDVLLVDGIAIAQGCHDCRHETRILIVAVDIGTELLNGILHGKNSRVFASLGIKHTNTIHVLDREIDVLEYLCPFTACTECGNGNCHANQDGDEN